MNIASALTPLPVLIPAVGAALTMFVGRHPRLQRSISLAALTAVVAVCVALIYLTDQRGTIAVQVGGWGPTVPGLGPLGITLVVDRLSALMMVVSSIVLLAVVLYAIGQGIRDGDERQPVSIFLPTYLVLSAGVCGAFLAGDLFNLFVGFEVLLTASFVLLTIGASADRVRAGIAYVMVSMVASLIFLFAHRADLRCDRDAEHGRTRRPARRRSARHPQRAVRGAARRVRHQGRGVPAVDVAARLLPHRARARHRRVRRPADESRCLRDHPGAFAAVSQRRAWTACCWSPRC